MNVSKYKLGLKHWSYDIFILSVIGHFTPIAMIYLNFVELNNGNRNNYDY